MAFDPLTLLRESVRAVPAVKYALGVAGLLAVVAITRAIGLSPSVAAFGAVLVLLLMVVLLVFARLTTTAPAHFLLPVIVLMWGALALVLATASLLFSSVFFRWPIDFHLGSPALEAPSDGLSVSSVPKVVQSQLDSRDYPAAWSTLAEALKEQPGSRELLELQAQVAERWVREASTTENHPFAEVVDPLLPVLYQAASRGDGVRAADAAAHVGWANFLKYRDGIRNLDIEGKYREALKHDPDNPFAHAMWGHWVAVRGGPLADSQAHFADALRSGRELDYVRGLQLSALQWSGQLQGALAAIRVLNEMRKAGTSLLEETRRSVRSRVYSQHADELLSQLDSVLPPAEHLATYQWLLQGSEASSDQLFFLARLTEAAGDCETARRAYVSLLGPSSRRARVREGLERCNAKLPHPESEFELLRRSLADPSPDARGKALAGLSALAADAKADPSAIAELVAPVLHDADAPVRSAASDLLAGLGRAAVPALIELLRGADPAQRAHAAHVLGKMQVPPKEAIPALIQLVEGASDEAREAAVEALAHMGPDAEAAVPALSQRLATRPSLGQRKLLIYALGEIGPAAKPAVPLLLEALRDGMDPTGFLNVSAAEALGKIGPGAAPAVPALIQALESEDVRLPARAASALGGIGAAAKPAIPALVEAMQGTEPEHRDQHAEAIGQIAQALAIRRDKSALVALRAALRAEEGARLDLASVSPLRAAIEDLDRGR